MHFFTTASLGNVPFSGLLAGGGGSCLILKLLGLQLPIGGTDEEEYVGDLGDDKEEPDGDIISPLGLNADGGNWPICPELRLLSEFSFKVELAAADTAALTA